MRAATLAVLLCGLAAPASGEDVWETPYPGVVHLERTTDEPWSIHAVLVDLCVPGVRVRASRHDERARVTSAFAAEVGAAVAINGDFFRWDAGFDTSGVAVGDGEPWPGDPPDDRWLLAAFGLERAELFAPMTVPEPEPWMSETIGGVPELVVRGVANDAYPDWRFCSARHPRTALGLTEDRRTLLLVTVDGRSADSAGMTCPELASLMAELGAFDAVNLDGGGSTAMVLGGAVVNRPSDGSERVVANHLAVVVDGSTGVDACPSRTPAPQRDTNAADARPAAAGCGCHTSPRGSALPWLLAVLTLARRQS